MEKSDVTNRTRHAYNTTQSPSPVTASSSDHLSFNELLNEIMDIPDNGLAPEKLRSLMQSVLRASPAERINIKQIISRPVARTQTMPEGERQRLKIENLCSDRHALEFEGSSATTAAQQSAVKTICNLPVSLSEATLVDAGVLQSSWADIRDLSTDEVCELAEAFRASYHSGEIADLLPALEPTLATQLDEMFGLGPAITALDKILTAGSVSEAEIARYNRNRYGSSEGAMLDESEPARSLFQRYFHALASDFQNAYSETDALSYFGTKDFDLDKLILDSAWVADEAELIGELSEEEIAEEIADAVEEDIIIESDAEINEMLGKIKTDDYAEKNHIIRSIISYTLKDKSDSYLKEAHAICSQNSEASEVWRSMFSGLDFFEHYHVSYLLDIVSSYIEEVHPGSLD